METQADGGRNVFSNRPGASHRGCDLSAPARGEQVPVFDVLNLQGASRTRRKSNLGSLVVGGSHVRDAAVIASLPLGLL